MTRNEDILGGRAATPALMQVSTVTRSPDMEEDIATAEMVVRISDMLGGHVAGTDEVTQDPHGMGDIQTVIDPHLTDGSSGLLDRADPPVPMLVDQAIGMIGQIDPPVIHVGIAAVSGDLIVAGRIPRYLIVLLRWVYMTQLHGQDHTQVARLLRRTTSHHPNYLLQR